MYVSFKKYCALHRKRALAAAIVCYYYGAQLWENLHRISFFGHAFFSFSKTRLPMFPKSVILWL